MKVQLAAYALRAVRAAGRVHLPSVRSTMYSVTVLVVMGFLVTAANLLFTAHYVSQNNHTWCQTLNLLTEHKVPRPADPAADPSRERAYQFYAVFAQQRHRLGCG